MKFKKIRLTFKNFDWLLFITVCFLIILGIILIYGVALGSQSALNLLNFKKQIVFFILGIIVLFFIAIFFDYRVLVKYNAWLYALGVILLVAVLFFGKTIRVTTGWFEFGPLSF